MRWTTPYGRFFVDMPVPKGALEIQFVLDKQFVQLTGLYHVADNFVYDFRNRRIVLFKGNTVLHFIVVFWQNGNGRVQVTVENGLVDAECVNFAAVQGIFKRAV